MLQIDINILNKVIISLSEVLMTKRPSNTWVSFLWNIYTIRLILKISQSLHHLSKGCHMSIHMWMEHTIQDVIKDPDIANAEYFCPL